jgi:hypothetical protein
VKRFLRWFVICFCIGIIGVGFAGCVRTTPQQRFERAFNVKLPEDAVVEYNYRQDPSGWQDRSSGWDYAVFKFSQEPKNILESFPFTESEEGEILNMNYVNTFNIKEEFLPDFTKNYLYINDVIQLRANDGSISWIDFGLDSGYVFLLYYPDEFRMIVSWFYN